MLNKKVLDFEGVLDVDIRTQKAINIVRCTVLDYTAKQTQLALPIFLKPIKPLFIFHKPISRIAAEEDADNKVKPKLNK